MNPAAQKGAGWGGSGGGGRGIINILQPAAHEIGRMPVAYRGKDGRVEHTAWILANRAINQPRGLVNSRAVRNEMAYRGRAPGVFFLRNMAW